MTRVERLTKEVRSYDRELYCKKEGNAILLCRKKVLWEDFSFNGSQFFYSRSFPEVIFCLTDDYTQKGNPVDMGIDHVLNRIKSIDGWSDQSDSHKIIDRLLKSEETKEKDQRNSYESFAYEWRDEFKKAFEDVNTSSLEKLDRRRNIKWQ